MTCSRYVRVLGLGGQGVEVGCAKVQGRRGAQQGRRGELSSKLRGSRAPVLAPGLQVDQELWVTRSRDRRAVLGCRSACDTIFCNLHVSRVWGGDGSGASPHSQGL